MNTFNNVANQYPPFVPVVINPYVACFTFVVLIGLMGTMHYLQHTEMIIILPILFLCASMMMVAWRRQKQSKVIMSRVVMRHCTHFIRYSLKKK